MTAIRPDGQVEQTESRLAGSNLGGGQHPQGTPRDVIKPAGERLQQIDSLLGELAEHSAESRVRRRRENQLTVVRLGIASGLFASLRAKHAPSASHSLRVALLCSAWGEHLALGTDQTDELEVAALLHDVGKIGVSDAILRKASSLTPDQSAEAQRSHAMGLQILAHCVPDNVLRSVANVRAWFDGSRSEYRLRGTEIPLTSRMIHIADVFDTMTTDSVYRKAMPPELVVAELVRFSNSQFDGELVQQFTTTDLGQLLEERAKCEANWLVRLTPQQSDRLWQLRHPADVVPHESDDSKWFHNALVHGLHDGVMFLNQDGCILHWSPGAEALTGLSAQAMVQHYWQPSMVGLRNENDYRVRDEQCPILKAMHGADCVLPRMTIRRQDQVYVSVDIYVMPVRREVGVPRGVVVVFRDASSQSNLEARVKNLHAQATTDPLTGVSNRAELDRIHPEAVARHLAQGTHYSLIICDIDRFKSINDKFGHQAGDEALVSFASVLKASCRADDVIARYGGEEFVVLCEYCDAGEATQLAEKIRLELTRTPLAELSGQSITASFGVTELQAGDSAETMLHRADRGLLQAKDTGRNRVVRLGNVAGEDPEAGDGQNWWPWSRRTTSKQLIETWLITKVPLQVAVEKLRGFIADHEGEILTLQGSEILVRITCSRNPPLRRDSDRPVPLLIDLSFAERPANSPGEGASSAVESLCHVRVRTARDRDRRNSPLTAARQVCNSLKSYLMAQEVV